MSRRLMFALTALVCLILLPLAGCNTEPKTGITVEITFFEPDADAEGGMKPAGEPMVVKNAKVGDVYETEVRAVDIYDVDQKWPVEVRFQDLTPEAAMFDFVILYTTPEGMPYNFSRPTVVEIGQPEKFKHNGNDFFEGNSRMGFEAKVTKDN